MRSPFSSRSQIEPARRPAPAQVPRLSTVDVAACYRSARVGGDYFEFVRVASGRLLLVLLDIAGEANQAMPVAAAVQELLHKRGPELFGGKDLNEAEAVAELVLLMNRTILAATERLHHTPGFVACYNESVGVLTYINAGHTPGLLKDADSVDLLPANGLPLGLFSHSTHDAQIAVIAPQARVLLVSRGLIEIRSGREEFGLERLCHYFHRSTARTAANLCEEILHETSQFVRLSNGGMLGRILKVASNDRSENDVTAVALTRRAVAASASAS
jgi:serine phosphatase RsbU (regulator of sigma subunit)